MRDTVASVKGGAKHEAFDFQKEQMTRTALLRIDWTMKNQQVIAHSRHRSQELSRQREEERKIMSETLTLRRSQSLTTPLPFSSTATRKSSLPSSDDMEVGEIASNPPVSDELKATLKADVSKNGSGREEYLRQRAELPQESRFAFPLTSTQAMAWRPSEFVLEKPKHPKKAVVKAEFYTQTGVM